MTEEQPMSSANPICKIEFGGLVYEFNSMEEVQAWLESHFMMKQ